MTSNAVICRFGFLSCPMLIIPGKLPVNGLIISTVSSFHRVDVYSLPLCPMESLNTFESEMEADGQGHYSLFPALDSISSLSGTAETLER